MAAGDQALYADVPMAVRTADGPFRPASALSRADSQPGENQNDAPQRGRKQQAVLLATELWGPAMVSFKYLSVVFHSSLEARAQAARKAESDCRAHCAELGIEAAPVQLQLLDSELSHVSHGAEVWGMHWQQRPARLTPCIARQSSGMPDTCGNCWGCDKAHRQRRHRGSR